MQLRIWTHKSHHQEMEFRKKCVLRLLRKVAIVSGNFRMMGVCSRFWTFF